MCAITSALYNQSAVTILKAMIDDYTLCDSIPWHIIIILYHEVIHLHCACIAVVQCS